MGVYLGMSIFLMVIFMGFSDIFSIGSVHEFHPDEREPLIKLRDSMNSTLYLHGNWTGPPCYGDESRWVGIYCSNGHVIHLVLEGIELTGSLPQYFLKNLTFLTKLSFRNNSISGPLPLPGIENHANLRFVILSSNKFSDSIPVDYIYLPTLVQLELQDNSLTGELPPFDQRSLMIFNVSNNLLQGMVPETPVLQSFGGSSFADNNGLCGKPLRNPCPIPVTPPVAPVIQPLKKLKILNIGLIAVGATVILFTFTLVIVCYSKKMRGTSMDYDDDSGVMEERKSQSSMTMEDPERVVKLEFFNKEGPSFNLDDILRSSAELMGKGKLGTTYRAILECGIVVTVKRLKEMNGISKKEFVQQLQLLGKMRHENLVEIISFYYSKEEKLVVYEHVSHGSLFEILHGNKGVERVPLNWATRLLIIKGVARGLAFLHQTLPSHKLPHGSLKSTNVLLDRHHHPKLTDFGFHPLLPSRESTEKLAAGLTPEFTQGKKLTREADIFCLGILMLEVITSQIPGKISLENDIPTDVDFLEWVRYYVNQCHSTDILDINILAETASHSEMLKLTEIVLECTYPVPEKRPKMSEVLKRIEDIKDQREGKMGTPGENQEG